MKKINLLILVLVMVTSSQADWLDDMKQKAQSAVDVVSEKSSAAKDSVINKYNSYTQEKAEKHEKKINECADRLEVSLPQYRVAIEQYYLDVNRRNESAILDLYATLQKKGISSKLQASLEPEFLKRLNNSTSTFQFNNIVITQLKKIQKKLKEGDPTQLDNLIQQTRFLLFSWTVPYEILATKEIYDNTLLGLNPALFNSMDKEIFEGYSRFIYSLMYINMVENNIFIEKDNAFIGIAKTAVNLYLTAPVISYQEEDIVGLRKMCEKIVDSYFKKNVDEYVVENLSKSLGIEEDKIQAEITKVAKNNNLYNTPVFLKSKNVEGLKTVAIVDNPLNDHWYMMIREYMELQDSFYRIKKEVEKIIGIVNAYSNRDSDVARLKRDMIRVDSLYRKLDETVRYNIIDLPISIYADLYKIDFNRVKKWYNDDEEKMADIAVAYNKACANMQKYMVSEFAIKKVMRIQSKMQSEFDIETEWKEIKTRAKLTQDWFNMLNKITVKNK